jgi:hypothetical protein
VYAARANFDAAPFTPPLLINGSNSTLSTSARESSALLPLSDPPAPPISTPSFANAARFQLSQSRQQGHPPPAQHPGSGGGSGRDLELGRVPPRHQLPVRPQADHPGRSLADPSARLTRPLVENPSNVLADPPVRPPVQSLDDSQLQTVRPRQERHPIQNDPVNANSVDISSLVDYAERFERESHGQFLEWSSHLNEEASLAAVRDSAIVDLSAITGLGPDNISAHLDSLNGDIAASFIASYCAASQIADDSFPVNIEDVCVRELNRRRQRRLNLNHSRDAVRTMHAQGPLAAYSSLAARIPLASELGREYRVDSSGIHLPPFPDRAVTSRPRHRSRGDLSDLVVSDHDSVPTSSPPASRRRIAADRSGGDDLNNPPRRRRINDDDDDGSSPSSISGSNSNPSHSEASVAPSGSEDNSSGSSGSGSDSEGSASSGDSSNCARPLPPPTSRPRPARDQGSLNETLTPDRLASLLERALSRKSGGNNGLLAAKPNFWMLGNPPNGGYHLETFTRLYREFKEFRRVYGKHTGVSFKRLISLDVTPLIRNDLKLKRREWKELSDSVLIKKLKARLGYQDCDHYIALLESCPRLPDKLKDTVALSNAFKDLSGKMLEIVERAHRHNVKLRKPTLKHVFLKAINSSYRMENWFHLEKFRSIGDSVRYLNTKIKERLSHELERKHEQEQDARANGVRGQIGNGTQESSNAPDRKPKRKDSRPPVSGGISKRQAGPPKGDAKAVFGNLSREDYRKKMDELYRIENKLPNGRFFHERGVYCGEDPCPFRRCQGCGEHAVKGKVAHDRPHCPHRKHKEFVAEGYFHEKYPGRLSIFATEARPSPAASSSQQNPTSQRSGHAARFNSVASESASNDQ